MATKTPTQINRRSKRQRLLRADPLIDLFSPQTYSNKFIIVPFISLGLRITLTLLKIDGLN